jgi:hypothetical protein
MAALGNRRSIEELLARYELEPTLQDVYVEGPTDRALVELALTTLGAGHRIRAYEIEGIDVPAEILRSSGLSSSNKSRVIALADELQVRSARDLRQNVVCLADRDFDGMLGRLRSLDLLVYTSRASLDAILATPSVVQKLLSVVLLAQQSADELIAQMLPILHERFLQRIACDELGIGPTHPDLTRLCTFDGQTLTCDIHTFAGRLLQTAGAVDRRDAFLASIAAYRSTVLADTGLVHVDDFLALLHFCARRIRSRSTPDSNSFRRFLFGLLEASQMAELPEIKEIASRFADP